jgi:PAS domain S-box-containing protein
MNDKRTETLSSWDALALSILIVITFIGVCILIGWHFHVLALIQIIPGTVAMQYNTAVCLVLLGISSWLLLARRGPWFLPALGGSGVALIGALVIFESVTRISLGMNTRLFRQWDRPNSGSIGVVLAVCFFSYGVALTLIALRPKALALFAILHTIPLSLGFTSLLLYFVRMTSLLPVGGSNYMSVPTAFCIVAYGGVMVSYAWRNSPHPDKGLRRWGPAIATIIVLGFFVLISGASQGRSSNTKAVQVFLGLAGTALLAIAVYKLPRWKISHKGLVLISVPFLFLLAFVIFVTDVKRDNEQAQNLAIHSKEVLVQSESLYGSLVTAEANHRGYILTENPAYKDAYTQETRKVPGMAARLEELVKDNPEQQAKAQVMSTKASERLASMARADQLIQEGKKNQAVEGIKTGVGKQIMDEFRLTMDEFLTEEERLDKVRLQAVSRSWNRFNGLLIVGASSAILLAMMFAFLFSHGISSRLLTLTENAKALAEGRELASPLSGKDEIAHLDTVFHNMAGELKEAARKELAVVENALDVICSIDVEGRFVKVSPACFKVWGYKPEELIGKPFIEFVSTDDVSKTNQAVENIKTGIVVTGFENRFRHQDGSLVTMMWSAFWSETETLLFCVAHDITERKKAEEEIKKLNFDLERHTRQLEAANKELEAFSYSVSHDLRAPLRAIDGFSRMFLEDHLDKLDEEGSRLINVIRNNTQKMGALIDDLLAFSRLGRRQVEPSNIDMTRLAKAVFQELRVGESDRVIELTVNSLPPAMGDPTMLRQVLVNLLSNAIKFTAPRESASIEVSSHLENGQNIYSIKDNGVGFDMQYAGKLFGVFQRLHSTDEFDGTGVGLAIVNRIVSRHGGRVWAEAKVNQGATFYFALPRGG